MGKPGTTLADPVSEDQRPDLRSNEHEIAEYFESQGAYDLFDYLLKELLMKQPEDPLQHMADCLEKTVATGPLQIIVAGAPGMGRTARAKQLASHFGLTFVSAGELLRESGVEVSGLGLADEQQVAELVMESIKMATDQMQGWVIDGFPRTRFQTSFLKEHSMVPTHVLVLKASREAILERHRQITDGEIEGEVVPREALEQRLNLYTCHGTSALESYQPRMKIINGIMSEEAVLHEMECFVRTLPRSMGPRRPPRVVLLGPRGAGVREHASRLASRLGAVYVDGTKLQMSEGGQQRGSSNTCGWDTITSIELPNMKPLVNQDDLGAIGVRLRQPDCAKQGYVAFGFVTDEDVAKTLAADVHLAPMRVVSLNVSVGICVARLRHLTTDSVTGKVWTTRPQNEHIRKRLVRNPQDQPQAVMEQHAEHCLKKQSILDALGTDGRCVEIPADGDPEDVFNEILEFVERPLPLR